MLFDKSDPSESRRGQREAYRMTRWTDIRLLMTLPANGNWMLTICTRTLNVPRNPSIFSRSIKSFLRSAQISHKVFAKELLFRRPSSVNPSRAFSPNMLPQTASFTTSSLTHIDTDPKRTTYSASGTSPWQVICLPCQHEFSPCRKDRLCGDISVQSAPWKQ